MLWVPQASQMVTPTAGGDVRTFQVLNILPTSILICRSLVGCYRLRAHFKRGLLITPNQLLPFNMNAFNETIRGNFSYG